MVAEITGRRRPTKPKKQARFLKRKRDDVDVDKLEAAVALLDPTEKVAKFNDLPLSEFTKAGLKACHYAELTDIQAKAIPLALKGRDILGAAKTGSGKTLAFLVPVLENLYRQQCVGPDAGLSAMIISPTRELAMQIFSVLCKIGKHGHMFAAGLVIGGKSLQEEQQALGRMNIVVCTPGRMLQHLSQTAAFSVDYLKMLVLDEADRIMDMGFQRDVDAILDYLPADRQTLLFSATQTQRVSDLARLSLHDPEYVSVHEAATSATPTTLQQNYILTPLPTKLDTLWSFIQSAKKSKLLVFLSSGKQVRFVYETFRKMQPGIPLLHLHGRQKQGARLEITSRFSTATNSCLFATDVVARGLDFPAVDWVVQVDCPEDADTYIHRVGRTARYERNGRAVLFLEPLEEEGMLTRLAHKKVPIERINVRAKKQTSIKEQLQNLCFKDPALKYLGQKAFSSYVRSVHLQKDKEIFQVQKLPLEEYAASLGLPGAPRIKFLSSANAEEVKRVKNAPRQATEFDSDSDEVSEDGQKSSKLQKEAVRTRYDRMFGRRNQDILSEHFSRMVDDGEDGEHDPVNGVRDENSEDELFSVKRRIPAEIDKEHESGNSNDNDDASQSGDPSVSVVKTYGTENPLHIDSNRRTKALSSKKKLAKLAKLSGVSATKLVFSDDGTAHPENPFVSEASIQPDEVRADRQRFVQDEKSRLAERDVDDREAVRAKRRAKKEKRKEAERRALQGRVGGAGGGENGVAESGYGGEVGTGDGLETMERPFAELADLYPSDNDERHANPAPEPKRLKKSGRSERLEEDRSSRQELPESLEDLENLARGMLET